MENKEIQQPINETATPPRQHTNIIDKQLRDDILNAQASPCQNMSDTRREQEGSIMDARMDECKKQGEGRQRHTSGARRALDLGGNETDKERPMKTGEIEHTYTGKA